MRNPKRKNAKKGYNKAGGSRNLDDADDDSDDDPIYEPPIKRNGGMIFSIPLMLD